MGFPKRDRKEYQPERERRREYPNNRDSHAERILTEVTCDNCGKSCKVPFKPTAGKPIYCSDCFRKENSGSRGDKPYNSNRGSGGRSSYGADKGSSSNSRELAQINQKLDKILELLEH